MTLRERLIVWADNKPWMGKLYVAGATLRDKRLAEQEFDKVEGTSVVYRKDGTVAGAGGGHTFTKVDHRPTVIEPPLDRGY